MGRIFIAIPLLLAVAALVHLSGAGDDGAVVSLDQQEPDDEAVTLDAAGHPRSAPLGLDDPAGGPLLAALRGKGPQAQLTLLKSPDWPLTGFHAGLAELLAGLMAADDETLRRLADGRLRRMGPRAALFVLPLLRDERTQVRRMAIYRLYDWRAREEEIPALDYFALLDDPDRTVANLAMNILSCGVAYEPRLAERLRKRATRPSKRREPAPLPPGAQFSSAGWIGPDFLAAEALARMGQGGVRILQALLADEEAAVRGMALRALALSSPEHLRDLVPDLERALSDEDEQVRAATLLVLDALEGDCVALLPRLLDFAEDEDGALVSQAIHILTEIGPPAQAAVPILLRHLRSPDEHLVDQAAGALGAIHGAPDLVLPALTTLLVEEGSDSAARAMSAYGPAGYRQALAIFRGDDPDARHAALLVFALQGGAAADVTPDLLPLLGGEDVFLRERAVRTVTAIGAKAAAAAPVLVEQMLREEDPLHPGLVGQALAALDTRGQAEMRRALQSEASPQRLLALHALRSFRGRMDFAADELEALLETGDADVREHVSQALMNAFEYPDGFARPPAGVNDGRLRELARKELTRQLALLVVHDRQAKEATLRALEGRR